MNIAYFAPGTIHDAKWLNEFAKNNCKVVLFCDYNIAKTNIDQFDKSIEIIPIFKTYKVWNSNEKDIISKILKSYSIQIIHVLYAFPYSLYATKLNYPYIITTRGSDVLRDIPLLKKSKGIKSYIINKIISKRYKSAFEQASAISSTSNNQIKAINAFISEKKTIKLIRSGIDLKKQKTCLKKLSDNKSTDTFNIFSPRSFLPYYNIDKIVDAFGFLCKKHSNLNLTLVNDQEEGEFFIKVKALIERGNIKSKVHFKKKMNYSDLQETYLNSDLVIMIPETDGTPNTALESMLCKTPVILGFSNYDPSIFNNKTCFFIQGKDIENIQEGIEQVLNYNKNELSLKLENAYNVVTKEACLQSSINKILRLYNEILH